MKLKIISMLIILAVLSVMPMIYIGKFDPSALISTDYELDFDLGRFVTSVFKKGSDVVVDKKVQVYKWRDQDGVMQFSSEPPPTIAEAEQIMLDPNSNLVQAVRSPVKEEPKAVIQTEAPSPYSMKGMKKVMDDAKDVEAMLQKRDEEQKQMLNDI